jgi:hypothetical protein
MRADLKTNEPIASGEKKDDNLGSFADIAGGWKPAGLHVERRFTYLLHV